MKAVIRRNAPLLLALLAIVLTIGLVSWGQKQDTGRYQHNPTDTVPKKQKGEKEKKIRDLDDVISELDMTDFSREMEEAKKEMAEAMKEFDGEKIKLEIEKAMKEVDMEKIQQETMWRAACILPRSMRREHPKKSRSRWSW